MLAGILLSIALPIAASGAVTVLQTAVFQDDNVGGGVSNVSLNFASPVSSNSVFIAGVYLDAAGGQAVSGNATFGGFSSSAYFNDDRVYTYVFSNSSIGSGASFDFSNIGGNPGIGVIIYEVGGADFGSLNAVTASDTIITTDIDELVISFASRNSNAAMTLSGSSIFSTRDEFTTNMKGGGSIASASTNASTPGSQDISWVGSSEVGRVAFSLQEAIPEPSAVALLGLGAMGFMLRRRRH